jgi:hypothetical protein
MMKTIKTQSSINTLSKDLENTPKEEKSEISVEQPKGVKSSLSLSEDYGKIKTSFPFMLLM